MKFVVRLFLIISILVPAAPLKSVAQKLPENCIICGHACCCPEMCAPKIKKMKEEANHNSHKNLKGCASSSETCRLQSSDAEGFIQTEEKISNSEIQKQFLPHELLGLKEAWAKLQQYSAPQFLSPFLENLTPPPKVQA